ncbi:MAG TPA: thiamine pyrophosphate-binding protein [Terriglobia bacterium]|nr:thiamine pyrophosphate-binding protein [Terriglobia bacterium]
MKLSDYVFSKLADAGLQQVFMVTGGAAMHLNDSLRGEPRLHYVCHHHEQAAAMAADGYARVRGIPAVVSVTAGPGGINALNGVFGAWTDSIPMLVISGQVKRETCMAARGITGLRQLGDQEVDIVRLVTPLTKYAALVVNPAAIRYHLERALYLATTGRPGPCWIDIPIDVQASQIDEAALEPYDPAEDESPADQGRISSASREVLERIQSASRPVILAGTGVRAAKALDEFEVVIRRLQIPVATAWTHDLIASDDPLFGGRPGSIGERAGNFTVQNADVLLVLGSRLNIRQVSYNCASFARHAFKIQVDVDAAELAKPTVRPDLAVHCDLKAFLTELLHRIEETGYKPGRHAEWLRWCVERRALYPVVQDKHRRPGPPANPYHFVEALFERLGDDDVVVCGDATSCIVPFQAAKLKRGQRMFSNSGSASMGYGLPAAIGSAVARAGGRVVCLEGDGSIQMNIQELQTVAYHRLPVKIFVLNNGGYLSIRTTQRTFFGRMIGESPASGVSFPDFAALAAAHGIASARIDCAAQFRCIQNVLEESGPVLCEVVLDPAQEFEPRVKSRQLPDGTMVSPALEDMYPFLSPEELRANLFHEDKALG